jgi:hypothetical protein
MLSSPRGKRCDGEDGERAVSPPELEPVLPPPVEGTGVVSVVAVVTVEGSVVAVGAAGTAGEVATPEALVAGALGLALPQAVIPAVSNALASSASSSGFISTASPFLY